MGDKTPYYAWSVDLAGHWDVDMTSRRAACCFLPWLGFCRDDDDLAQYREKICAPEYAYSFAGAPHCDDRLPPSPPTPGC